MHYKITSALTLMLCMACLIFATASFAGTTTTYVYDELDRIKEVQFADGNGIRYEYDKIGNLRSKTPFGNVFTITASASEGGSISPMGTITITSGNTTTYSFVPLHGFKVVDVVVDGVSMGAISTYTFANIAANHSINAYFLDANVPTGTIVINGGASLTTSLNVTLTLTATGPNGVSQMQFSNDNFYWSPAEAYATSKAWTLPSGDWTKTVYVKFIDAVGNWSTTYRNKIFLDANGPTGGVIINADEATTMDKAVTLTLPCTDINGCSQMQLSNNNILWNYAEKYAESKPWLLTTDTGPKTVYVKFKDNVGNWSPVRYDTIIYGMNWINSIMLLLDD